MAQSLIDRIAQVNQHKAKLTVAEMELRTTLAQRYGREFPPRSDYLAAKSAAKKEGASPYAISEKRMMRDLIGRRVSRSAPATPAIFPSYTPQPTWTFDGIEEFHGFTIVSGTNGANLAEYGIRTGLKGLNHGHVTNVHLRLAYEKNDDAWKLRKVEWLAQE